MTEAQQERYDYIITRHYDPPLTEVELASIWQACKNDASNIFMRCAAENSRQD